MGSKEKTVVMVGGGLQEIDAVKIAQEAGYKVLVTDKNENAPCFDYCDYKAVQELSAEVEQLKSKIEE